MAEISVTASAIRGETSGMVRGTAGASITAGQTLYLDSSNLLQLADANNTSADEIVGIALHASAANQPLVYARSGNVTFNAALTAGVFYVVGTTAGSIAPISDATTGWRVLKLGYASSTTNLVLEMTDTGVTL